MESGSLKKNKEEWNDMAELDIYWFIITEPKKRFGKWDISDFFRTGEWEVKRLMERTKRLGPPKVYETVLDFGCGVGRTTRYFSRYFKQCYGADISKKMIDEAKRLNKDFLNCEFVLNEKDNLNIFPDNYFDLIYTRFALQHIPDKKLIRKYLSEFVRTLKKNGLLVFQIPCHVPFIIRTHPRMMLYKIFRKLGLNKEFLYNNLKLYPLRMTSLSEKEIFKIFKSYDLKLLRLEKDNAAGFLIKNRVYYVTK